MELNGWCFSVMGALPSNMGILWDIRRKFGSQTSDNMDRWKAEQGRGREKRKIRRKKSRRERVRRKKMQMREKVGKSRNTVFFPWFVALEGRKVGSLKRRVRSQLALVQSQVRFNMVLEKVPEKVPGGFGAEPGHVQQGSEEGSGEGLGGFGAKRARSCSTGLQEGSGAGAGRLWCRARSS